MGTKSAKQKARARYQISWRGSVTSNKGHPGLSTALYSDPAFHSKEPNVAKGQKRGNREIRKPKADKPPTAVVAATLLSKGIQSLVATPKKKS
jgi:hypothetical protein